MIRQSIVFPLALRAIGSNLTTQSRIISISKYSHSTVARVDNSADEALYNVLKHEINTMKKDLFFRQEFYWVNKELNSFPFKIKVDDDHRSIKLKRNLPDDEEVTVTIDMNAVITKETESSNHVDDKESKKVIKEAAIPMKVEVYKYCNDDEYIEFEITLSKEDITVQRFRIFNKEKYLHHTGPKKMDCGLQQWLRKYLEIRGINTEIASYLLSYIAMQNKKVDMSVLKTVFKYIEF